MMAEFSWVDRALAAFRYSPCQAPCPISTKGLQAKWCNDFISTQTMENGHSSDLELLPKANGVATRQLLDTRRAEALDAIDRAPFWFRVRIWMVACSGFFIDMYDLFAINLAYVILGYVYGRPTESSRQVFEAQLSTDQDTTNQYISKKNRKNKTNRRVPKSRKFK